MVYLESKCVSSYLLSHFRPKNVSISLLFFFYPKEEQSCINQRQHAQHYNISPTRDTKTPTRGTKNVSISHKALQELATSSMQNPRVILHGQIGLNYDTFKCFVFACKWPLVCTQISSPNKTSPTLHFESSPKRYSESLTILQ